MARSSATPVDLSSLIGAAPEPPPRARRDRSVPPVPVEGLETFAALSAVAKEIKDGFLNTERAGLDEQIYDYFIQNGLALGRCPPNFKGQSPHATASLQLRLRTPASPLTPEEVEKLNDLDLPVGESTTQQHTYRLKPDVFKNKPELVQKMLKTLDKAGFNVGELFEEQREKSEPVAHENVFDELFAKAKAAQGKRGNRYTPDQIREVLAICGSTGVRPDWHGTIGEAFDVCKVLMSDETPEATETAPARGPFPNDLDDALAAPKRGRR